MKKNKPFFLVITGSSQDIYFLLLMTASKRKDSVGAVSPMSLHIFHLSQWAYSQSVKLLYLDLVAADLSTFADTQKTKQIILCGRRQEHVNLKGSSSLLQVPCHSYILLLATYCLQLKSTRAFSLGYSNCKALPDPY